MVKPSNASSIQISLFGAPELTVTPPQAVVEVVASPTPSSRAHNPLRHSRPGRETVQPSESEHSLIAGHRKKPLMRLNRRQMIRRR